MPLLSSDVIMVPPQYQHQYYQDFVEYDQSNHKEKAGFMSSRLVGHDYYSVHHDEEEGYINNYNCLGSDIVLIGRRPPLMAEDDQSRTTSSVNDVDDGGGGSSSKDVNVRDHDGRHGDDRSWLQLGLSLGAGHDHHHHPIEANVVDVTPTRSSLVRGPLVELDLLPSSSTSQHVMPLASSTLQYVTHHHDYLHRAPTQQQATNYNGATSTSTSAPLFLQHHHHHHHQRTTTSSFSLPHQQEITWGPYSRPNTWNSLPSSSLLPPSLMGSYYGRTTTTFHHPSLGLGTAGAIASDMRVIDAPQRPHSGVWFVLQASQNQSKEPFLPQIPKNYLRIKDGRITVRVLMKYVANKLRLSSESEVEITCRGQQLLPYLTLQHIRDHIWNTTRREVIVTLLPHSSTTTTDHIMVLHYGRSTA